MTDIRASQGRIYTVRYGDRLLRFLWRPRDVAAPKARIHVYPDGRVEVETPESATLSEAKQALLKRASWVTGHLGDIQGQRAFATKRDYVSGETVFYLGRRYVLKVMPPSSEQHVKMSRGQLQVMVADPSPATIKAALAAWYRKRAKEVFARRLLSVSGHLPWVDRAPDWSIRVMKRQWGSCSPSGQILLNPHLIKTPTRCIDYVILHELCHLREHNHSADFYRLLKRAMPAWQEVKAKLDSMSELYLNE